MAPPHDTDKDHPLPPPPPSPLEAVVRDHPLFALVTAALIGVILAKTVL